MARRASTPPGGLGRSPRGRRRGWWPPWRSWTRSWPLVAIGVMILASERDAPRSPRRGARRVPQCWRVLNRVGCLQPGPELAHQGEGRRCHRFPSMGVSFRDSATSAARRSVLAGERVDLPAEGGHRPGLRAGLALRHVLAALAGSVAAGAGSSRETGAGTVPGLMRAVTIRRHFRDADRAGDACTIRNRFRDVGKAAGAEGPRTVTIWWIIHDATMTCAVIVWSFPSAVG